MSPKWIVSAILAGLLAATWAGIAAAADPVPRFDVQPSCRGAAVRANSADYVSVCVQDEQRARDKIAQSWSQFKADDKSRCVQLSRLGGQPTYTELLTCLELSRDERSLPKNEAPITSGQAPK